MAPPGPPSLASWSEEAVGAEPRLGHPLGQVVAGPAALLGVPGEGPVVDRQPRVVVDPGTERPHAGTGAARAPVGRRAPGAGVASAAASGSVRTRRTGRRRRARRGPARHRARGRHRPLDRRPGRPPGPATPPRSSSDVPGSATRAAIASTSGSAGPGRSVGWATTGSRASRRITGTLPTAGSLPVSWDDHERRRAGPARRTGG